MENRVAHFSLQYLEYDQNRSEIPQYVGILSSLTDGDTDLNELLEKHRVEHGVTIGCLKNESAETVAIAGLFYLEDAALYEVICEPVPGNEMIKEDGLNYIIGHAFYNLGMDKLCARANSADTAKITVLKNAGFNFCGERAFSQDGRSHIWNYYELENEGLLTTVGQNFHNSSDWDGIF